MTDGIKANIKTPCGLRVCQDNVRIDKDYQFLFFFLEEGLINLNWQDCDILYYMD